MIRELINFYFKCWKNQFIDLTKVGGTWTDKTNQFKITFDKDSIEQAIIFLLYNCFFNFGNLSSQKITGIAIGSDPAPFIGKSILTSL